MNVTPVIMGANRGAYGLARAFYEKYGVKTVIISPFQTGPVRHSAILHFQIQAEMQDVEALLASMAAIERKHPGTKKMIFASDDRYAELLMLNRERFAPEWLIPYSDYASYVSLTDKTNFRNLCEQLGLPHPRTVILQGMEPFKLAYPVIIKAAQTPEYQNLTFKGKKKVYLCHAAAEATAVIATIRQAGYRWELLVQEYIPGNDTFCGIVTVYVAQKDLQIKLFSFANVLVDDPTPSALGNSLAGWVREEKRLEEPIKRMIEATGFYCFATLDVKYDARRNAFVFFELNGRLGLSNYYVTAAGHNVAEYYVEDFLLNHDLARAPFAKEIIYSSLPQRLLARRVEIPDATLLPAINPLVAAYERHPVRSLYIALAGLNFYRKLWKYAPLEGKEKLPPAQETSLHHSY